MEHTRGGGRSASLEVALCGPFVIKTLAVLNATAEELPFRQQPADVPPLAAVDPQMTHEIQGRLIDHVVGRARRRRGLALTAEWSKDLAARAAVDGRL